MLKYISRLRLPLVLLGCLLVFISNRYLAAYELSPIFIGIGFFSLIFSLVICLVQYQVLRRSGLKHESKIWIYESYWIATILLGLGLYYGYAVLQGKDDYDFLQKLLLASWVSALVLGASFGIGIELGVQNTGRGENAEPARVLAGGLNWLSIGLFLGFLVSVNYAGAALNRTFDWSYFKTTEPGEATKKMVDNLVAEIEVGAFFSRNSEVTPFVQQYLETLQQANANLKVSFFDKDFNPTEAERFRVSSNGQIVLLKETNRQRLTIGDDIDEARKKLRSLDASFQKAILPLMEDKKVIYLLQGHGEMGWKSTENRSSLRVIKKLEGLLRAQNFRLREFSLSGGAFNEVPEDAAVVAIVGPAFGIPKDDMAVIQDYVNRGGSLLIFLDTEFGGEEAQSAGVEEDALTPWLASLGITFEKQMLANDRVYYRATRKDVDKWFLGTNNFSSHESVKNLTQLEDKMGVVTFQSGYFVVDGKASDWVISPAIRSLASSFVDLDRNFAFDDKKESRSAYAIAVAGEKGDSKVLAFSDATMVSDPLIANPGNQLAIIDSIRWLSGIAKFSGTTESEEDVKIQHAKGRDEVVFYGSIYAIPVLVLIAGYIANRRKRRRAP